MPDIPAKAVRLAADEIRRWTGTYKASEEVVMDALKAARYGELVEALRRNHRHRGDNGTVLPCRPDCSTAALLADLTGDTE